MFRGVMILVGLVSSLAAEVREDRVAHAGAVFRVVTLDPEQVRVVWRDELGKPYETFDRVQSALSEQGKKVRFMMNAGIFF